MSGRVRFAPAAENETIVTPAAPIESHILADIFKLPLPKVHDENSYVMDIFSAASLGHIEIVSLRIREGRMNDVNCRGWSALLYAAQLDHTDIAKMLIDAGSNVNCATKKGQTALMLAASCGNIKTVNLLLSAGADVAKKDLKNRTALHMAAACEQHEIVIALLNAKADPNASDMDGMTPTLEACNAGHDKTLKPLLDKGGNAIMRNGKGEDGIMLAADRPNILELIEAAPCSLTYLLHLLNMHRFEDKFHEQRIETLEVFFTLNHEDLNEMALPYGPKMRLQAVIEHYNAHKEIRTDLDAPAAVPVVAHRAASIASTLKSAANASDLLATLKVINDLNAKCKRIAVEAFEHKEDASRTLELFPQLIACCDAIATRIAMHTGH